MLRIPEIVIKIVKVLSLSIFVIGLVVGLSCTFLYKKVTEDDIKDTLPCIDSRSNIYYKEVWFSCWKVCSPKTPRINPKSCDCSCSEELKI